MLRNREATVLSLNELVRIKRKTVQAPIARYKYCSAITKNDNFRDRSNSLTTVKDELSPQLNNPNVDFCLAESQKQFHRVAENNELATTDKKAKASKAELTFDNTNGELATR